jgi:hypothetical protein
MRQTGADSVVVDSSVARPQKPKIERSSLKNSRGFSILGVRAFAGSMLSTKLARHRSGARERTEGLGTQALKSLKNLPAAVTSFKHNMRLRGSASGFWASETDDTIILERSE